MLKRKNRPAIMKSVNSRWQATESEEEKTMVAGYLREKNGIWHMVIELRTSEGKRKTISRSTHLPVKGNKKKAERMLLELRKQFSVTNLKVGEDILFADF